MSVITGREPGHWHTTGENGKVRHNMTDPRTIPGWSASYWSDDERAFVEHLRTHEAAADPDKVVRDDADDALIISLFDLAEHSERKTRTLRELILAIRHARSIGMSEQEIKELVQRGKTEAVS